MESFVKSTNTKKGYVNSTGKPKEKNRVSIFFSEGLAPRDQIKLALKYPSKF
jgi:hypothetical protein